MKIALALAIVAACAPPPRAQPDALLDPDAMLDAPPDAHAFDCVPEGGNTCYLGAVVPCNPDGTFGSPIEHCGPGLACSEGACVESCTTDGVDLVYVVTLEGDLMSFDPRKLPNDPFTTIGHLACPTTMPDLMVPPATPARPFSMAVDRDGVAWVEYGSGEVFQVSIADASCTASSYVPLAADMKLFGMGFVTDTSAGVSEKLFIAGGRVNAMPGGNLARVDPHAAQYTPVIVGPLSTADSDMTVELTGTNEAKLYGFFPKLTTPSYVQEIDKATGARIGTSLPLGANGLGAVAGWAFAQWGGRFYVFVSSNDNSTVREIDGATGHYAIPLEFLPFTIVGAGVSTCAPTVFQ